MIYSNTFIPSGHLIVSSGKQNINRIVIFFSILLPLLKIVAIFAIGYDG